MNVSQEIKKYVMRDFGFYIECGANDGIRQSNTLYYERELGWRGMLIEASPIACAQCRINRDLNTNIIENCALVSADYREATVIGDFDGNLMSSIGGTRRGASAIIEVPACTLSSLLDKRGIEHVDFFSLDVEGKEFDVLNGINFSRHRPTWILVEVYDIDASKILTYMAAHAYMFKCNLSGFNRWDNPEWDGTHNDYLFVDAQIPEVGV